MVLLGEKQPGERMVWKKCGARHKARFCAYGIYANKAQAFAEQLGVEEATLVLLKRFNQFQCTIYIPHFLASSIGADAPFNDITLYRKLENYRVHDVVIA